MFCMNCGNKLEDDSKFCTACGSSINGVNNSVLKQTPKEKVQEKEKSTKKGKFIAVGIAIIGIIVLLANTHTCKWCNKTYVGAQYYDMWDTSELMCKDCALEYYMGPGYKNYKK